MKHAFVVSIAAVLLGGMLGCVSNTITVDFEQEGAINSGQGGANQASSRPLEIEIFLVAEKDRALWGSPTTPNIKPTQIFGSAPAPASELMRREHLNADFGKQAVTIELPKKFRNSNESSIWIYARYQGSENQVVDSGVIALDKLKRTERIRVGVGPQQLKLLSSGGN